MLAIISIIACSILQHCVLSNAVYFRLRSTAGSWPSTRKQFFSTRTLLFSKTATNYSKEMSFLLRQVSVAIVSPIYDWKHFQQMRVGQTASIPVSLSLNPTSRLTTIWCAFLMNLSPHPCLSALGGTSNKHRLLWRWRPGTFEHPLFILGYSGQNTCSFNFASLTCRIFRSTFLSCTTWSLLPPTPTCPPTKSSAPTWRSFTSSVLTSRGWARARRLYLCQNTGNIGGSFTPLR